jgi:putative zinc finger/helix-turn-helix YgiT family protein
MKSECPDCGFRLVKHVEREEYDYKGKTSDLDTSILRCSKCGKEIVNPKERDNHKKRIELSVDGFLTDRDIKRIRQKLRLTQHEMADKLGSWAKNICAI